MTKPVAKREACFLASRKLETLVGSGWLPPSWYSKDDEARIMVGIQEIINEMEDRGWESRARQREFDGVVA